MAAARQKRTTLLERLTPRHPDVQSLDATIADLTEQIKSLRGAAVPSVPPHFAAPQLTGPQLAPPAAVPAVEPVADNSAAQTAARDRFRELTIAAGRAQAAYDAALGAERSEWVAYSRLATAAAVTPSLPTTIPHVSAPQPVLAIGVLLLLAALSAMIAARGVRRPEATFATSAEIEAELGFPVLGSLAVADRQLADSAPMRCGEPLWIRRSVSLGELVLALAIGTLIVLAMLDLPLMRHILADPIGGIGEGFVKLRSLAGK